MRYCPKRDYFSVGAYTVTVEKCFMIAVYVFVVFFNVNAILAFLFIVNANGVDLPQLVKGLGIDNNVVDKPEL